MEKSAWTSQELYATMTGIGSKWHVPLGHTVMVANSKSEWYARINEKGQPLVDRMAADLLQDIQHLANNRSGPDEEVHSSAEPAAYSADLTNQ